MPCFKNLAFQEMIQHVIHLWTKATFQLLAFVSLVSWVRCTQRFGRLFVFPLSNFLMNGICYAIKWKVHCFIILNFIPNHRYLALINIPVIYLTNALGSVSVGEWCYQIVVSSWVNENNNTWINIVIDIDRSISKSVIANEHFDRTNLCMY